MRRTVRTTFALPVDLLRAADQTVAQGAAISRNDLVAMAVQQLLASRERAVIDAGFVGMSTDPDYCAESAALEAEFDRLSWEAFRQAEANQE